VGNAVEPSLAILAEIKPDLIVGAHNPDNPQFHAVLSKYAPTLLFNDLTTRTGKTNIQVIGKVLGHEAEASRSLQHTTSASRRA
jgi:ABC-type Fe3+-citrate transport system substrate-binding protein